MINPIPLEICINAAHVKQAAKAASYGNADRIELCSQMDVGGLTPSTEAIKLARQAFPKPGLMVMIRPRAGDFVYSLREQRQMFANIHDAKAAGADGVVLGALKDDAIDVDLTKNLVQEAQSLGLSVTFHRAFDAVSNRTRALEHLIEIGVDRVLSSGTAWGSGVPAHRGLTVLEALCNQAAGRLELVVGGGVTLATLPTILSALTHCPRIAIHVYTAAQAHGLTSVPAVTKLQQALANAAD